MGRRAAHCDLVVAQQSLEDGWYEAMVIEANGEMLTLRWRDYSRERKLVRHRLRVGLRYPGPTGWQTNKAAICETPTAADKVESTLPADWQDIDLNKLVLAKDDGPSRSWWEAIPVDKTASRDRIANLLHRPTELACRYNHDLDLVVG